jgi:hypothetical protein
VAVIDSGVAGCVFSDTLLDELLSVSDMKAVEDVSGLSVDLPRQSSSSILPLTLSSNPEYWFLTSFRLRWFRDGANHPHVIALGVTFLAPN